MQVLFRHEFFAPTGYGNSAREIAFAMEDMGVDLKLEPIGGRYDFLSAEVSARLQSLVKRPLKDRCVLLTEQPMPRQEDAGKFVKTVSCVMWETTKVPHAMAAPCNRSDAMVLPNTLNQQAFRHGGVHVPIYLAPYGVNPSLYHPDGPKERFGEPDDVFVFVSVFGWSERKGPDVLIEAFAREFSPQEPVVLILKTHGLNANEFPHELYQKVLNDHRISGDLRIRLIVEAMPPEKVAAMYRGADCFVLATRAEGVGLPILESMACQTPVMATGWGGHSDFFNPNSGYPIPYQLKPASRLWWTDLYGPDQLWAEPDAGALQVLMRRAVTQRSELLQKGENARKTAVEWNWGRTARAFVSALEEVVGEALV